MKKTYTIDELRAMKMTDEEKSNVWDGVMRRTTDYPEGEYPFEKKPSSWDGVERRKDTLESEVDANTSVDQVSE